jgi:hypothetical protein
MLTSALLARVPITPIEKSPFGEANSRSANKIRSLLWTKNIHYSAQTSLPLASMLSQMNPVHSLALFL